MTMKPLPTSRPPASVSRSRHHFIRCLAKVSLRQLPARASHLISLIACSAFLLACNARKPPSQEQQIAAASVHPGPIRHEQLTATQMERIGQLQQTFSEVDPSPLEKWVDDFKRDRDPEREIRIYEGMAAAYTAYCTGRTLTLPARKDVYEVVILRSGAPDAEVLPQLKLGVLTVEDAREILRLYRMAPAPITVSTSPPPP